MSVQCQLILNRIETNVTLKTHFKACHGLDDSSNTLLSYIMHLQIKSNLIKYYLIEYIETKLNVIHDKRNIVIDCFVNQRIYIF